MKNRFLEAGKIVNTHGVHGEVKLVPWCDSPEFMLDFSKLYLNEAPLHVLSSKVHKGNLILHLEGIDDVESAMRLVGSVLFIDREDAELPEGRIFQADLIGLEVRSASDGRVLGTLIDVLDLPAHPVYVVRGEKEYLIPAVEEFLVETNPEGGYLRVRLIEGMGD
jgi:16S rRNA processing protein RimM